MATVKHHKVVAALPAELEPDALYLVRSGAGFDLYATNHSGLIAAYPLNVGAPGQGFFRTEAVTAAATGQTSFTVPGGYTPGAIIVSLNGAVLPPADYTATNGTTVVLASGAGIAVGAVLLVYVLSAFDVADALPLGGTAADASKLGGIAADQYATIEDLAGVTPGPEFYKRSNILGTVSQAGGVPTGAIIERGENANGEYVRWADGTLECWNRSVNASCVADVDLDVPWALPANYKGVNAVVSCSLRSPAITNNFIIHKLQGNHVSEGAAALRVRFSVTQVYLLSFHAIGRWY